ncbi:MAG: chemotaxis protein CheW [Herpetosiphonaceae bacterium]|nr:chemotaxis protein CheW [Herpetosiphonaceae bacterium]
MLIAHIGDHSFALPVSSVERIIPMAAPTILPEAVPGMVGVLNYQGTILPVVDPRPRFNVATPPFHIDQLLIIVRSARRYLLWVNSIEGIVPTSSDTVTNFALPLAITIDNATIPVLSPLTLDPGPTPRLGENVAS